MAKFIKPANYVQADQAYFIKLGSKGRWEERCIKEGNIRLGYDQLDHDLCIAGQWEQVKGLAFKGDNAGSATRHIKQVQSFYEASNDSIWITFYAGCMYWCKSAKEYIQQDGKEKIRPVIGNWSNRDIGGALLTKNRLSGKLLAVQGFQGTICAVRDLAYLLRQINGEESQQVIEANSALGLLENAMIGIIRNLHPKDLETLTDLIFRQGGWQRTGVLGETEKDIDLDLMSPITKERIAVQVKSQTSEKEVLEYLDIFEEMSGYSKFYFVTHTELPKIGNPSSNIGKVPTIFWGVKELSQLSIQSGLVNWLIDKAS